MPEKNSSPPSLKRIASPLILAVILLTNCALQPVSTAQITPRQVLATAAEYTSHQWVGHSSNVYHGVDRDGIPVDTPDDSYSSVGQSAKGWWKVGRVNKGVPYKWGGFDTPSEFDQKLLQGFYAGDVYTHEKRKLLESGVSKEATGIDCSGFISRCWGLQTPYSTRTLHEICTPLSSYDALQAGDILNKSNEHVVLFVKPVDKDSFLAYEAVSDHTFRVVLRPLLYKYFRDNGYHALRYQKISTAERETGF